MDKIRSCRWCGKLYQGYGENFCPECVEKMDEAFVTVRAYLDSHPRANAADVKQATGLEERIVLQLLKDERLQEYTQVTKSCEICGRIIQTGRFCDDCKKMMKSVLNDKSPARDTKRERQGSTHHGRGDKDERHEREREREPATKSFSVRLYDEK